MGSFKAAIETIPQLQIMMTSQHNGTLIFSLAKAGEKNKATVTAPKIDAACLFVLIQEHAS